jgi:hypothetical protein
LKGRFTGPHSRYEILVKFTKEGIEVLFYSFLNLDARRWWVVKATPWPLYPWGRDQVARCIGDWVEPSTGLDEYGKSRPKWDFDPLTVQSIARYDIDRADKKLLSVLPITELRFLDHPVCIIVSVLSPL